MKPALVFYMLGSLSAPVPFSFDALGMPWEFVGVYSFLWEIAEQTEDVGTPFRRWRV